MLRTVISMHLLALWCIGGLWSTALQAAEQQSGWSNQRSHEYTVEAEAGERLHLPPPVTPNLEKYNEQTVRERLSRIDAKAPVVIQIRRMFDERTMHDFTASERATEWAKRQFSHPAAIFIKSGVASLEDVYRAIDSSRLFDKAGPSTYVARLPLVVEEEATLVLEGKDVLRFSQERGAFFVVEGNLFSFGAHLVGWSENRGRRADFNDAEEFRPFLVTWSGSELYLVNSIVESFGYNTSKSYGLTVSRYSEQFDYETLGPPQAWIIGSTFIDMYYGFYCYYADYLVLVGNTYRDNIVYGIDPHDYSRGLIIANNTVTGTKEKHGIIISREVDDSWIINNRSYNNANSGFVIDRASSGNVFAYNESFNNGSDGITIYESSDNLLWGNAVYSNKKHGINARNSVDVRLYRNRVIGNGRYGVYGHIQDLDPTSRDLDLDPYTSRVSLTLVGGTIGANQRGSLSLDQPLSLKMYDVELRFGLGNHGVLLDGTLGRYQDAMLDTLIRKRQAAILKPAEERLESD